MTRHERDLRRLMLALADEGGARFVALQPTRGGHSRAVLNKSGVDVSLIAGASPSDRRWQRSFTAFARRTLRAIAP
jgi:hypothetical protein